MLCSKIKRDRLAVKEVYPHFKPESSFNDKIDVKKKHIKALYKFAKRHIRGFDGKYDIYLHSTYYGALYRLSQIIREKLNLFVGVYDKCLYVGKEVETKWDFYSIYYYDFYQTRKDPVLFEFMKKILSGLSKFGYDTMNHGRFIEYAEEYARESHMYDDDMAYYLQIKHYDKIINWMTDQIPNISGKISTIIQKKELDIMCKKYPSYAKFFRSMYKLFNLDFNFLNLEGLGISEGQKDDGYVDAHERFVSRWGEEDVNTIDDTMSFIMQTDYENGWMCEPFVTIDLFKNESMAVLLKREKSYYKAMNYLNDYYECFAR